jgi:predicted ATPase
MLPLERPAEAPDGLRSKRAGEARRRMLGYWLLDPKRRAQTNVPALDPEGYDEEIITALAEMSHNRCAFCEADAKLFVHRYRPPGNALPLQRSSNAHLYYLWLADAWQNLYPICAGCVPQEPQFPVTGARAPLPPQRQVENYVERGGGLWPSYPPKETPVLLDPARERGFESHFIPKLDGDLYGDSRRGETTIIVHDLNRGERRHQRSMAYRDRLDTLSAFLGGEREEGDPQWEILFSFDLLEFGGSWYLLLRRVARAIAAALDLNWQTSPLRIARFFERLHEAGDAPRHIEDALEALRREDMGLRPGRWATGSVHSVRIPLTSLRIENFKAIEALTIDIPAPERDPRGEHPPAPSLMILGENATGKSSILEAIALTLMSESARGKVDVVWPRIALDPSQLGNDAPGARRLSTVRAAFATGQSVTLYVEGGYHWVMGDLGNQRVPIFGYGAFRRYAKGTQGRAPHRHVRNLFDGDPISNPEPWLKKLHKDDFNLVVRTLRDLLSIEGEFDVIARDPRTRQLRMVTSLRSVDGTECFSRAPLHAVSSGYRSMLAMLCDIMRGLMDPSIYEGFESFETAQGIVLIDEIEAHLHPRWKVQVMGALRKTLPRMTFIVTTHDPLCLRGMADGEILVLHRISSADSERPGRMPMIVERMANLPPVAELRVEQLLTSDFFQLLSSDDAAADRRLAKVADLIAARGRGEDISPEDARILRDFEEDIAAALPVGSSEVHRIVQEAVAAFLAQRRTAGSHTLARLRAEAKQTILTALGTL